MARNLNTAPHDQRYTIRYAEIVGLATAVIKRLSPNKKPGTCSRVFQETRRRLEAIDDFIRLENQEGFLGRKTEIGVAEEGTSDLARGNDSTPPLPPSAWLCWCDQRPSLEKGGETFCPTCRGSLSLHRQPEGLSGGTGEKTLGPDPILIAPKMKSLRPLNKEQSALHRLNGSGEMSLRPGLRGEDKRLMHLRREAFESARTSSIEPVDQHWDTHAVMESSLRHVPPDGKGYQQEQTTTPLNVEGCKKPSQCDESGCKLTLGIETGHANTKIQGPGRADGSADNLGLKGGVRDLMHAFSLKDDSKMGLGWPKDANQTDGETGVREDLTTWSWLSAKGMLEGHRQTLHGKKPRQELPMCELDQFYPPKASPFKGRLEENSLYEELFTGLSDVLKRTRPKVKSPETKKSPKKKSPRTKRSPKVKSQRTKKSPKVKSQRTKKSPPYAEERNLTASCSVLQEHPVRSSKPPHGKGSDPRVGLRKNEVTLPKGQGAKSGMSPRSKVGGDSRKNISPEDVEAWRLLLEDFENRKGLPV